MRSTFVSILAGLFIVGTGSFGAKPQPGPEVQARLLDENSYRCQNCFFGASSYYYCFEADNKVLIGYQKTPALVWKDHDTNLLTKVHKSWQEWPSVEPGATLPIRYDEQYIWVTRPDGKQVQLKQDYHTDIFISNSRCRVPAQRPAADQHPAN